VRAEIERECERLSFVQEQMRTIEVEQRRAVAAGTEAQVARLVQLRAIGIGSGWVLVKELFGWRGFRNRRDVAGWHYPRFSAAKLQLINLSRTAST
jgi:transposase